MNRLPLLLLLAAALAACASLADDDRSGPRIPPGSGPKLAIRTVANKTQQFGLEDALGLAVRDEFLRDARYPVTTEKDAQDVLAVTLTRYTVVPTQYDSTLAPTTYKLRILINVTLLDRGTNQPLWEEKDLEGAFTYPATTLMGGMTEPQAQAEIWTILAPMIVSRVAEGFRAAPTVASSSAPVSAAPAAPAPR